jgi:hypothetical protein
LLKVWRPVYLSPLSLSQHPPLTFDEHGIDAAGEAGFSYAQKYLNGAKWVDSEPTTIVEFDCPQSLIRTLFERQQKPEDGAMSHGLGDKGGKGLPDFNATLSDGDISWRIMMVKRKLPR